MNDDNSNPSPVLTAAIPTINDWEKNYGRSCEGNDQKAVKLFREYESKEKFRRFQFELQLIKDGKVRENVLDDVLGRKRMQKFQGYDGWAKLVLLWLAAK